MNFIFKSKQKSPAELVRSLRDAVSRLEGSNVSTEGRRKAGEEVSKNLFQIKYVLQGDGETEPQADQVAQLAQEAYNNDLLQVMVQSIAKFEFEVGCAGRVRAGGSRLRLACPSFLAHRQKRTQHKYSTSCFVGKSARDGLQSSTLPPNQTSSFSHCGVTIIQMSP